MRRYPPSMVPGSHLARILLFSTGSAWGRAGSCTSFTLASSRRQGKCAAGAQNFWDSSIWPWSTELHAFTLEVMYWTRSHHILPPGKPWGCGIGVQLKSLFSTEFSYFTLIFSFWEWERHSLCLFFRKMSLSCRTEECHRGCSEKIKIMSLKSSSFCNNWIVPPKVLCSLFCLIRFASLYGELSVPLLVRRSREKPPFSSLQSSHGA